MGLRRRQLVIGSALGGFLSRVLPTRAASPLGLAESTLTAYVDVLIPADDTPSGTSLGVDEQLLRVASGQRDYGRLLKLGLDWLDTQARGQFGRSFPELDETRREALVRRAAEAGYHTIPRIFFERTRADAFFHYYGRRESWRGMAHYSGPPQPRGFPDYTEPPRGPV